MCARKVDIYETWSTKSGKGRDRVRHLEELVEIQAFDGAPLLPLDDRTVAATASASALHRSLGRGPILP